MKMYEQIGEFTPDSLIVSPDFPILKSGIGLKPGYGILKRGSLIVKAADGSGYLAGTEAAETSVFGILTDDTDTGTDKTVTDNIPAVVYQTGEFNPEAVKVADGATVGEFEDEMKKISIFLRAVQNY